MTTHYNRLEEMATVTTPHYPPPDHRPPARRPPTRRLSKANQVEAVTNIVRDLVRAVDIPGVIIKEMRDQMATELVHYDGHTTVNPDTVHDQFR